MIIADVATRTERVSVTATISGSHIARRAADREFMAPIHSSVTDDRSLVGRYHLDAVVSESAQSCVYRATRLEDGARVAVKMLVSAHVTDRVARARLQREAIFLAGLRCPSIVRILDVGQNSSGTPFLVMEFFDGQRLDHFVARHGPFSPVDTFLAVMRQILDAMSAVHAAGVVHRDIKSSNILVRYHDGRYDTKLLDFGISKSQVSNGEPSLTGPNEILGSPAYMSPEQIEGQRRIYPASDVWSLGVVMYEMLVGKRPFSGRSIQTLAAEIATIEPDRPVRPGVPPYVGDVVMRCLSKSLTMRFADARALRDELFGRSGERTTSTSAFSAPFRERLQRSEACTVRPPPRAV